MKAVRWIMNQIIISATVSLLLVGGGLAACTALDNNPQSSANLARINLPHCMLGAANTAGDCTIKVFDGNALVAAQQGERGEWFISVASDSVTAPRIAVYSAPGYEPQIQSLKINLRSDEHIVLKARGDQRGGYLAGVVFKKTEEKMKDGVCGIENFMANKQVIVNRSRARFTTTTDNIGSFQMELPAGHYMVHVEQDSRAVDVPNDDTLFIMIPVD